MVASLVNYPKALGIRVAVRGLVVEGQLITADQFGAVPRYPRAHSAGSAPMPPTISPTGSAILFEEVDFTVAAQAV